MKPLGYTLLLFLTLSCVSMAQSTTLGSGHWEGAATIPGHDIQMTVDLSQDGSGAWTGSMSFPDEKTSAMKLSGLMISDKLVVFRSPVTLEFKAMITADGGTMSGTIKLAAKTRPVQLKRTSASKLKATTTSSPIAKQIEGTWEGTLKYGKTWGEMTPPEGITPEGATFGLRIRFATGPDGFGIGKLSRMDEPIAEFPLDIVLQNGDVIHFEFFSAGAVFDGRWHGDEIVGEWRQVGSEPIPLTLRRASGS
jgi:hypothetical protein